MIGSTQASYLLRFRTSLGGFGRPYPPNLFCDGTRNGVTSTVGKSRSMIMDLSEETRRPLVLVVDDDETIRYLAKAALEQQGCLVHGAENGAAGLSFLRDMKADLILLDVMMPEIDGFTFCQKLKELPDMKRVPVLMMTALEDTDAIRRAYH